MELFGMNVITNDSLPSGAFMLVRQDGDGIEVATPEGVKFFTWEDVLALKMTILQRQK